MWVNPWVLVLSVCCTQPQLGYPSLIAFQAHQTPLSSSETPAAVSGSYINHELVKKSDGEYDDMPDLDLASEGSEWHTEEQDNISE